MKSELEKILIEEQHILQKKLSLTNEVDILTLHTVAGVDLAYWEEWGKEYAVCCIVVLDYQTHEVIEKAYSTGEIAVPYIPGCLAFREIPLFLQTYRKISTDVQLIFFDGNGYLHPRHMGLASHAGLLIDKPSVGVAKSYFKVLDTDFEMPADDAFSYTDITISDVVYGRVLRTHKGIRPVFLSVGNRIDLETATKVTESLVTKDSHIPLPTRLADVMTHEMRSVLHHTGVTGDGSNVI